MRRYSHQRNKKLITAVANKLQTLCNDVTFVGGAVLGFLITDELTPDVRFTMDVDCIVNIVNHSDYYKLSKKLREKGLKEIIVSNHPICRWKCDHVLVDIMPTDKKILGFSNRWYCDAIENSMMVNLNKNIQIKIISPTYFIATKLDAFFDRGKNDFLGSHDLEDIISLFDGRPEIVNDVKNSNNMVKNFITSTFSKFLKNKNFLNALPGHLNYSNEAEGRKNIVIDRMNAIFL